MPVTLSPLRYPGGKTAISDMIAKLLSENDLPSCHYAEPYAGGGGLALSLLFSNCVQDIHLNDLDRSIWAFWYVILYRTDEFIEKIVQTPVTMEEWHNQRHIQENKELYEDFELGFSTFFLNRTNRSGIILKAGVIGGLNQQSKYKLDCRFNKSNLIKKIKRIHQYKDRIHIYNKDAIQFMRQLDSSLPAHSIFYIDPPYFAKGALLYTNFYDADDHKRVAETVQSLKHKWVLTYDNAPEIHELYLSCRRHSFSLNYSAAVKRKGTELLITHHALNLPSDLNIKDTSRDSNGTKLHNAA